MQTLAGFGEAGKTRSVRRAERAMAMPSCSTPCLGRGRTDPGERYRLTAICHLASVRAMCDELRSNYQIDRRWAEEKISVIVGAVIPTSSQNRRLRLDARRPGHSIGRRVSNPGRCRPGRNGRRK
jgi:hypothetical protein